MDYRGDILMTEDKVLDSLDVVDPLTIRAIGEFSILWNHFENYMKSHHKREVDIINKNKNKNEKDIDVMHRNFVFALINKLELSESLVNEVDEKDGRFENYIKSRSNNSSNEYNLKVINKQFFKESNDKEIDDEVIRELFASEDYHDKLCFLYFIVKKVRNNMFHGNDLKAIGKLSGQYELFEFCKHCLAFIIAAFQNMGTVYISKSDVFRKRTTGSGNYPFKNIDKMYYGNNLSARQISR